MIEPDDSIFSLLRARRTELQRDVPDADRCFALNEAWLERLKRRPDFHRRIADGESVLAGYLEGQAATRSEPTDATPPTTEPRD